jgi:thiamine biosynthesis lipoprotein ApbE
MATLASVTVTPQYRDRLPELTGNVRSVFQKLEDELSIHKCDSEISRLARAAGKGPTSVSDDTLRILELSKRYGELTRVVRIGRIRHFTPVDL